MRRDSGPPHPRRSGGLGFQRRFGVEEEFLLLDPVSGALRPIADEIVDLWSHDPSPGAATSVTPLPRSAVKGEFFLEQVELASEPCGSLAELEGQLRAGRSALASIAGSRGAALAAVAIPLLPTEGGQVSPRPRYQRIGETYGLLAQQALTCAMHVHVEVESDEEAIGVMNRLGPWLPPLVAISANSPYWQGIDTGHDSWRSMIYGMWPSSGPPQTFRDAEEYHQVTNRLIEWGAATDRGMLNFGARPSASYPTVEVRVADTCTDVADSLLVAALVRALVANAAEEWRLDIPSLPWRAEELRAALWQAARYGVADQLVDPFEQRLVPAAGALKGLFGYLAHTLERQGAASLVTSGFDRLLQHGNGAAAQRRAHRRTGDLVGVAQDVVQRTHGSESVGYLQPMLRLHADPHS